MEYTIRPTAAVTEKRTPSQRAQDIETARYLATSGASLIQETQARAQTLQSMADLLDSARDDLEQATAKLDDILDALALELDA